MHVAGTNGKGSVIAFLGAMLEAAGHRVHVYTSPHLVRFHERIRLAGRLIEEAALVALLEECEAANGDTPITFFEITTAAAFLAFAREPADILLLETGLGGRLDATNVIGRPRLSVITPVSIDHVQYLGETIEDIAFEKAGILKPGVEAVLAAQPKAALGVLERRAAEVGAPLHRASRNGMRRFPAPALLGDHQLDNAACALACADRLADDFDLDDKAIASGLETVTWPGRLQRLERGSLAERLPDGWELWLDGAHNAAAGEALARVARGWDERPLHLVYGMLNTKAAVEFLRPLAPLASSLHALAIPGVSASLTAQEAARHAAELGYRATMHECLGDALVHIVAAARREGAPPARVLVCGSLYLVGRALAENA